MKDQNYISVDGKCARNSYNEYFAHGDEVRHEDDQVGTATIISFEPIIERNEIRVKTDKGYAHLDFIHHL